MGKDSQRLFFCLTICLLIALGPACGADESDSDGNRGNNLKSVENFSEGKARQTEGDIRIPLPESPKAGSVREALEIAAASQGIFVGEVPEGFPTDFLPLYPDGTIDRSSVRGREATLLQVLAVPKDKAISYFRNYYKELGWVANDPIAAADRTIVSFSGNDARVDMTLIEREEGTTLVALSLY